MNFSIEKVTFNDLDEILSLFKNTIVKTCSEDYNDAQISVWTSSIENRERWIIEYQHIVRRHNNYVCRFAFYKYNWNSAGIIFGNNLRFTVNNKQIFSKVCEFNEFSISPIHNLYDNIIAIRLCHQVYHKL